MFPGGPDSKESACDAGDPGSVPGSGIFPAEGNGNPLQYSCLENSIDRGDWQATQSVHAPGPGHLIGMHMEHGSSWQMLWGCCLPEPGQTPRRRNYDSQGAAVSCSPMSRGVFPTQGLNPRLLTSPALAGGLFTIRTTWEAPQSPCSTTKEPWDKKPMHHD